MSKQVETKKDKIRMKIMILVSLIFISVLACAKDDGPTNIASLTKDVKQFMEYDSIPLGVHVRNDNLVANVRVKSNYLDVSGYSLSDSIDHKWIMKNMLDIRLENKKIVLSFDSSESVSNIKGFIRELNGQFKDIEIFVAIKTILPKDLEDIRNTLKSNIRKKCESEFKDDEAIMCVAKEIYNTTCFQSVGPRLNDLADGWDRSKLLVDAINSKDFNSCSNSDRILLVDYFLMKDATAILALVPIIEKGSDNEKWINLVHKLK